MALGDSGDAGQERGGGEVDLEALTEPLPEAERGRRSQSTLLAPPLRFGEGAGGAKLTYQTPAAEASFG